MADLMKGMRVFVPEDESFFDNSVQNFCLNILCVEYFTMFAGCIWFLIYMEYIPLYQD